MSGGMGIILKCFGIGMVGQVIAQMLEHGGKRDLSNAIIIVTGTTVFYIAVNEIYKLITTVSTMFNIPM